MDALRALPTDPAAWPEALARLTAPERTERAEWIVREWADGGLEARLLATLEPHAVRALRRVLAASVALAGDDWEYERRVHLDEAAIRRWCWIRPWILMPQDEDLLLMTEQATLPLLEEAVANCPKKGLVFAITLHHARDHAHAALRRGPLALQEALTKLEGVVAPAAAAGHVELAAYLRRLVGYRARGPVDEQGARARISDLTRCAPRSELKLERTKRAWRAKVSTARMREEWIEIDRHTGEATLEVRHH